MDKKIKALYLLKRYGTYADIFMLLGLALVAEDVLKRIEQKTEIQIIDEGIRYCMRFKQEVDLEAIATLEYTNLFIPVVGSKTDRSNIPEGVNFFDTVKHAEERKRYRDRDYVYQGGKKSEMGEDEPFPPDPRTQNGVILTSMRHDRNHNSLWEEGWKLRENFGDLVVAIFQAFGEENNTSVEMVAEIFKKRTGKKLPPQASSVKIFMPTAVQGVNRVKTDNNKSSDSQKEDWLTLWLIAAGLFEFGLAERVKVGESSYDWRAVGLKPKDISLYRYRVVLQDLRLHKPPSGGHGIARFDAELVLKFSQALLNKHPAKEQSITPKSRFSRPSIKELVTGFSGTHFGSKGQVYGVKDIFSLGFPDWIRPENLQDVQRYLMVIKENLSVVQSLSAEEGHGELLAAYRDFITGNGLESFFPFQVSYADYVVRQLADPKAKYTRLFSTEVLDIMVQSLHGKKNDDWSITEITENPGFLRIARAINSSTVHAGKIQTKQGPIELDWQRNYGLAQRLTSQASSKKDFIIELSAFLSTYENENLRIREQNDGKTPKRIWPTKEDLDQVIGLINDERFGSSLVANLLVAYGYAKWPSSKEEQSDKQLEPNTDNTDELNSEN